jgi:hypothetical protein
MNWRFNMTEANSMPYYNLRVVSTHQTLSEACSNDSVALTCFGALLGTELTLEGDGPTDFLLAKRHQSLGWVSPRIPVWRKS